MENKKFLIIGAGSYLGKNYLDYLLKKKLTAYGVSSFYESDNIFKITNLNDNLIDLINSVKPDIIFDFKLQRVSSNKDHYPSDLKELIIDNKKVATQIKKFNKKNLEVHLISTSKLNNIEEINHPYLNLKKEQELHYLDLFGGEDNLTIHRVENVIGFGDFNFSRILPYNFGSIFKNGNIVLNSNKNITRNYLTIENFMQNLLNFVVKNEKDINDRAFTLKNFELLDIANSFIESKTNKNINIKWLNEVDYLSSPNPVLKITKFDVQKIKKISKWYWNNRVEVLNKFEQFNY